MEVFNILHGQIQDLAEVPKDFDFDFSKNPEFLEIKKTTEQFTQLARSIQSDWFAVR